ncbi:DUF2264 domain-containing protein [Cellulosilyticum sp. I15G10I2]|uniref:DUF2264 domain-containing protein n=1 Tax=Cellulosilyticum sp. I15G10I2 TaxID=1892843 RepID=UPI00085CA6B0|nr:DUF2264 domain-containing protein [Cellulosilyticum sp. I15G10I2]
MKALHTQEDFQNLLMGVLNPLEKLYSPDQAGLDLGSTGANYDHTTVLFEAFARPLWGLAPYWAGGGETDRFEEIYRAGIAVGTDKANKNYWGGFFNEDQRFVEMAALAFGFLLAPDKIWEPLSEGEKNNLADWLKEINAYTYPDNNWWFFEILVNTALKKLSRAYDAERLETGLKRIEDFYVGGGWYQDGKTNRKDYYISFAIHFYSLIYVKLNNEVDVERCSRFRERAQVFAKDFIYWFDEEGAAIPYGRSQTYRFAQCAFWGAYVFADLHVDGLDLGIIKGLIVRHMTYWMEKPIFDRDGVLTIGYHYPNLRMAEIYNAPGSPYWALKAFVILALPSAHSFWHTEPKGMPTLENKKHLPYGDVLMQRMTNHAVLFPTGIYRRPPLGHFPEKYGKFAYSSKFGFSVAHSNETIELAGTDSMLAFEIDGSIFIRRESKDAKIEENGVRTLWSPIEGIEVETWITLTEKGHRRRHIITSQIACRAFDCGFAVDSGEVVNVSEKIEGALACVKNTWSCCEVVSVEGEGRGTIIHVAPNTNLMTPRTKIPAVIYQVQKGITEVVTQVITSIAKKDSLGVKHDL